MFFCHEYCFGTPNLQDMILLYLFQINLRRQKATTLPLIVAKDLCFRHPHIVKQKIQIMEGPVNPNL